MFWFLVAISIFTNQIPQISVGSDEWELGTKFDISAPGKISTIKFYKIDGDNGVHTGRIWSGTTKIAEVIFSNETSSGWQEQNLIMPLVVSKGTYVVSVNSPKGAHYAYKPGGFSTPIANDGISGTVGMYGSVNQYPNYSTLTNYFRDVKYISDTAIGKISFSQIAPPGINSLYAQMTNFKSGSYNMTVTITDLMGNFVTESSLLLIP